MAIEVTNFEQEVLQRSREVPVVVDFWAPWCGPCRALGPVLEGLAAESGGRWVLAKVNTDENPEVSMQYGIRGIPAVKMFVDGDVSAEFTGALPEYAVRKWLDEQIPTEDAVSVAYATSLLDEGRVSEAQEVLEDIDSEEARVLLARLIVFADPDRASALVESVAAPDPTTRIVVDAIQEMTSRLSDDPSGLPDGAGKETFAKVLENLRSGHFQSAAEGLISVLQSDRYYSDDAARKLGIALFNLLGPDHPVARDYRRRFDMHLF